MHFNQFRIFLLAGIIWECVAFTPSSFPALPLHSSGIAKCGISKSKCSTSSSKSRMDSKHRMDETVPENPSADWNLCTPIRQGGDAAMNIGKAALKAGDGALKAGDAALKVGDAKLKAGEAAFGFSTCAQSAIYAAVAFFTISTLQPISKYLVFTAVTGAALLPFPSFWRFLKKVLRASVSAIIKVCYRFPCDIRSFLILYTNRCSKS